MWNLSQEIAENYVLRFKESENKKEDPYYRNIPSRLKDIQEEASEILFQLYLYDLAYSAMDHYKHHGRAIPEDIVSMAFRRFMWNMVGVREIMLWRHGIRLLSLIWIP